MTTLKGMTFQGFCSFQVQPASGITNPDTFQLLPANAIAASEATIMQNHLPKAKFPLTLDYLHRRS